MLEQIKNGNRATIEGIVSEIALEDSSIVKNDRTIKVIRGTVKVRVDTVINGENVVLEIPVSAYAAEFTTKGEPNPAYDSLRRVRDEYVSIAASDIEHADRVRINRASISMNEYYNRDGKLVSFPRISSSFFTKISAEDCHPDATFEITMAIGQMKMATDIEGVETGDLCITAMIPQYGGKVDVIPFIARNRGVVDAVSQLWSEGDTVVASGKINFSSKTETTTQEVAFGEPTVKTRTVSVSELIITSGSEPLEADFAINERDLQEALVARKERLAAAKDKAANKTTAPATPKTAPKKFADIDF